MSRSFSLAQLRERLIELTDIQGSQHFTTDELNAILVSAMAETWDKIITSGMSEKHVKTVSLTTVAGTIDYDLNSSLIVPDQDFYKIFQIYVDEGAGQFRPLPRIGHAERQAFRPPQTSVSIIVNYIPVLPTFKNADGDFDDTVTFDGINGWEEHTLNTAAIAVKAKRQDSTEPYYSRKRELEARISTMADTDYSEPSRVIRRRRRYQDPFMLFRNNINAWSIKNDKLQLYYHYGYIP